MLNYVPQFKFLFWRRSINSIKQNHFEKILKIKPKSFFAKLGGDEFKQYGYLSFELFNELPDKKEKLKIVENNDDDFWQIQRQVDNEDAIIKKSEMPDFIDLHIEKLEKNYSSLNASQIIQMQLRHFQSFLENAIRYQLHKIYVVHGIGKGVLKQQIENLLLEYPDVKSYNNNYTPRFGFGATEIFLD